MDSDLIGAVCREMCMDLISLETEEENRMVEAILTKGGPTYIRISETASFMGQSNEILHPRFFPQRPIIENFCNVNFLKIDSFSLAKRSLVTLRNS
jgi:hypothetical protein